MNRQEFTAIIERAEEILAKAGIPFTPFSEMNIELKEEPQMEWERDLNKAFAPLFEVVRREHAHTQEEQEKFVSDYMYMGTQNGTFFYKHEHTRDYVLIKNNEVIKGHIENYKDWEDVYNV